MKTIFVIYAHNIRNDILIFDNKETAVEWCRKATMWDDTKIAGEIKEIKRARQGFFMV